MPSQNLGNCSPDPAMAISEAFLCWQWAGQIVPGTAKWSSFVRRSGCAAITSVLVACGSSGVDRVVTDARCLDAAEVGRILGAGVIDEGIALPLVDGVPSMANHGGVQCIYGLESGPGDSLQQHEVGATVILACYSDAYRQAERLPRALPMTLEGPASLGESKVTAVRADGILSVLVEDGSTSRFVSVTTTVRWNAHDGALDDVNGSLELAVAFDDGCSGRS